MGMTTVFKISCWLLILSYTICVNGKRLNVLFLVSDDMRPDLGAYRGPDSPTPIHPKMYTPNLDKLASKSLLLKKAYVQQAVCSPSRTSLLTGRRPDTTRVHDLTMYWRTVGGDFTTIPQYFKNNGYATVGMGKVFHSGSASHGNDPISWNEKYFTPTNSFWRKLPYTSWHAADVNKTHQYPLPDTQIASHAVETLKRVAPKALSGEQPFFVAVGFHRPHLPFVFPANFLDYYPVDDIRLPSNPYAPVGMPDLAWSDYEELRTFVDVDYGHGSINTTLPDFKTKELRRAYYAAISYVDNLVGQVMKSLDDLGLSDSTVVSFWGDHGWQLGEHGEWCKHTNFELSTHAPMMVHVPGLTDKGVVTEQLTEFVDLFPTLAEVAGLPPVPLCPEHSGNVTTCTEGVSMVPLMKEPKQPWKSAAFSQYPRMLTDGDNIMGYRIRTEKYSYTLWRYFDTINSVPFKRTRGMELYDHVLDPEENVNVADHPKYAAIRKTLDKQLKAGWREALPSKL